jgi:putative OPT family oligopeptide transporter
VAAVVCCSAAIAGDSMQELKTAQILGATPVKIQYGRFIGVIVGAIVIPFIVGALASAYGIGSSALPSPQAVIMGSTVHAIFQMKFNYIMFSIGVVIAIILIWRKLPVMAVAIGIYLPFTLTTPIFLGGILGYISEKFVAAKVRAFDCIGMGEEETENKIKEAKEESFNKGLLFAAGLVAGEAVLGVIIALFIIMNVPLKIIGSPSSIPGLIVLIYVMTLIVYMVIRDHLALISRAQAAGVFRTMFRRK